MIKTFIKYVKYYIKNNHEFYTIKFINYSWNWSSISIPCKREFSLTQIASFFNVFHKIKLLKGKNRNLGCRTNLTSLYTKRNLKYCRLLTLWNLASFKSRFPVGNKVGKALHAYPSQINSLMDTAFVLRDKTLATTWF